MRWRSGADVRCGAVWRAGVAFATLPAVVGGLDRACVLARLPGRQAGRPSRSRPPGPASNLASILYSSNTLLLDEF